jgi:putative ABC transport system permease protein
MNFFESIRTAILDLALHKFRSALATLGIIFGVASVEAMISISEGARRETLGRIAVLGVDNVILRSVKPADTQSGRSQGQDNPRIPEYGLLRRDLTHVREALPHVKYAVGVRNTRMNLYSTQGKQLIDLSVIATEPDYLKITRSNVLRGRFISPIDGQNYQQVCVVGYEAARKLFGYDDPLQQSLRIGNDWFTVVGILENQARLKEAGGDDINKYVFIPLELARIRFGDLSQQYRQGTSEVARIQLDGIEIQMSDDTLVLPTAERLRTYLSATHNRQDYELLIPLELMRQKAATQRIFTVVMASIASISLLIGGIGIMNIMLANVADRRKEIGTRRALGARKWDIIVQFVLESATLTALGGVVGVGVGYALSMGVSRYAGWPVLVTPSAVLLGLVVSCLAGITFGLWPAYQAAKVNPIEALRSD